VILIGYFLQKVPRALENIHSSPAKNRFSIAEQYSSSHKTHLLPHEP
jgi:hypothetical protein